MIIILVLCLYFFVYQPSKKKSGSAQDYTHLYKKPGK